MEDDFSMFESTGQGDQQDMGLDAEGVVSDMPTVMPEAPDVPPEAEETPYSEEQFDADLGYPTGDDADYPHAPVSTFDAEDSAEGVEPEEDMVGAGMDLGSMVLGDTQATPAVHPTAMISPLSMWEIEHERMLAQKREASADKHDEHLMETKAELEAFYEERAKRIEGKCKSNREDEVEFVRERDAELEDGKEWEQVMKYVQVSAGKLAQHGSKDTSRIRQILFQMKASQA